MRACAASILIALAVYGATFPAIPRLFPSVELARAVRTGGCRNPQVATAGYHEPSLVFLTGTETAACRRRRRGRVPQSRAGAASPSSKAGRNARSSQRADAIGLRYFVGRRVDGFNLSGGRSIIVAIYRAERVP